MGVRFLEGPGGLREGRLGVPSRGAGVFPVDPRGRLLVLRRTQGAERGSWAPPGGHLEAGESPMQGALREFAEEAGYTGPFRMGRSWANTPSRSRTFPLQVRSFRPRLSAEHDRWAWVKPGQLSRYPLYSAFRNGLRNVGAYEDLGAYAEAHAEDGEDWSRFYPRSARGDDLTYVGEEVHWGRNVGWPGTPREMVSVDPDYAFPIEGNLFDWDKLASVAEGIRSAPGRVTLRPGYGEFFVINRGDIAESLQYGEDQTLGRSYTTGDEELDAYLMDPEDAISDRDFLAVGERGYKTALARFEKELRQAERNQDGDFGELAVQVRDGNHRTFGAILAGEPVVWLTISRNQLQDLDDPDSQWKGIRSLRRELDWKMKKRRR